jgi:hypothetical protein
MRKDERRNAAIDRDWPHQVALPEQLCTGMQLHEHRAFGMGRGMCERTHTFLRDDVTYIVYCFAQQQHAEAFQAAFGGEISAPKDRPRWPCRR